MVAVDQGEVNRLAYSVVKLLGCGREEDKRRGGGQTISICTVKLVNCTFCISLTLVGDKGYALRAACTIVLEFEL